MHDSPQVNSSIDAVRCLYLAKVAEQKGHPDKGTLNGWSITVAHAPVTNSPPTAVDDNVTVVSDGLPATLDLVANDTDPEGNSLLVVAVDTTGTQGTVDLADGVVAYTAPGDGYVGPDSFTYTIDDGNGGTDSATVNVTVTDPSAEQTFASVDVPKNIADPHKKHGLRPVTSQIDVSTSGTIAVIEVDVDIMHGLEAGLTVTLESSTVEPQTLVYHSATGNWSLLDPTPFLDQQFGSTWTLKVQDSVKNRKRGTLIGWSMVVEPAPIESAQSQAAAIDQALLAWGEPESSSDDESDILTKTLADDLALMLVE